MNFPPRRVVTGHDAHGRAIVVRDEIADDVTARRVGHRSTVLWTTDAVPADIDAAVDLLTTSLSQRSIGSGTVDQPGRGSVRGRLLSRRRSARSEG